MTLAAIQPRVALRVSVTDRCHLRCLYCLPAAGPARLPHGNGVLTFEEIAEVVRAVTRVASSVSVRITGGEPLLRPDLDRLVAMLARLDIGDIALTTNGQLLADLAGHLKAAGLRRLNVSLDTLHAERYCDLARGGRLADTLSGIDAALDSGLRPVKLNTVVLRGINDAEVCDLARFAMERGCQMRFIELMPVGEAAAHHRKWFVSTSEVRQYLEQEFEIGEQLPGPLTAARTFPIRSRTTGLSGIVGFISPVTHPFCSGCGRLRLTSGGELLPCLMHAGGLDLRRVLRNGAATTELESAVGFALALKSAVPRAARASPMATIGG